MAPVKALVVKASGVESDKVTDGKHSVAAIVVNGPDGVKRCVSESVTNQPCNLVRRAHISIAICLRVVDRHPNRVLHGNGHEKCRRAMQAPCSVISVLFRKGNLIISHAVLPM